MDWPPVFSSRREPFLTPLDVCDGGERERRISREEKSVKNAVRERGVSVGDLMALTRLVTVHVKVVRLLCVVEMRSLEHPLMCH